MTHSPLPWRIENHYSSCAAIKGANGEMITGYRDGELFEMEEDDAILAVTAVNAHAALVAALEACRDHIIGTTGSRAGSDSEEMVKEANAALELARKGGA